MPKVDPLHELEHDHGHLTRLVFELREQLHEAAVKDPQEAHAALAETIHTLGEDLVEHFAREEEGLFPFVSETVPELREHVQRLSGAHDTVCGAILRMRHAVGDDAAAFASRIPSLLALHERFDVAYTEHSRDERALLDGLKSRLDPEARRTLATLLQGL
jgi:hypothetical protein